ncbi:PaaI family thioesterase [Spirosoma rhododendri]|uniref:PaaI family thioesterase n=1 Tax=Spirosoma rhododendri TaxID=2728024 RepID=A0A7L5DT22_9BACT|nr:PaaI family thioesterase [Spirosoma rhododendri]QJD79117.1 PaaI family thioesterase [Spirosoma rhododendri]
MDTTKNTRLDFFRAMIGRDMSGSISPLGRWLNVTLRQVDEGLLVADLIVREDMTNPAGMLHGGATCALLDDLVGAMVFSLNREYLYVSVNMNVDFLHAARLGDMISIRAEAIRAGRNIVHCEGRIVAEDGKIIAKCSTNLVQTNTKLPF